jgi:hypothetical protein
MKQLLSLFLFLLPCLALAQYPSNGNQKITLGEQTTADGLIFRGVAATDTVRKPSIDTMAYVVLDTTTNIIWHYKKATSNAWLRVGGSISSGVTGTLPVANGGTGSTTLAGANIVTGSGTINYLPKFTSTRGLGNSRLMENDSNQIGFPLLGQFAFFAEPIYTFRYNGVTLPMFGFASAIENVGTQNAGLFFSGYQQIKYFTENTFRVIIDNDGDLGVNIDNPTEKLHVVGNARITGAYNVTTGSAANVFVTSDGVLQRSTSSIKYKSDVEDYTKGLNEVMKLRPVTYKSINSNSNKIYAGFIAEELADLKLTELYENNDYGEPDAISYAYMVTLLTKAIQEQQEQITILKKRLLILENK